MTQHLFVYGSLGPGKPYESVLTVIGGTWQAATVRGRLVQQGWGAAIGFPGLVLDDAGDEVGGHVFSSDNLTAHWDELDATEGEDYRRVLVVAKTAGGQVLDAYVYALAEQP